MYAYYIHIIYIFSIVIYGGLCNLLNNIDHIY